MSDQNLEIVRRFVDLWSGKDLVAMAQDDPDAIGAMMACLTEDVEVRFSATVEQGTNHGADGSLRALMEWLEPWAEYFQEAQEFIDVDSADTVVVTYRQWGRGRTSGIDTEMNVAHVYAVRDGKISQVHEYSPSGCWAVGVGASDEKH